MRRVAGTRRSENLASDRADGAGGLIVAIQGGIADPAREPLLEHPPLVQQLTHALQARPLAQNVPHLRRLLAHRPQVDSLRVGARPLPGEDLRGGPRRPGVEHHQVGLQLGERCRPADHRIDEYGLVRIEDDVLQPPVRSGVLILLADRLAHDVDLDPAGLARQSLRRGVAAGERVERVQQTHGEARRGSDAGTRRNIRDRGDLQPTRQPREPEALAHDGMPELLEIIDDLGLRVAHPQRIVESPVDRDVHVAIDRDAGHRPGLFGVERAQIGAAAGEADAEWRPGDDHPRPALAALAS